MSFRSYHEMEWFAERRVHPNLVAVIVSKLVYFGIAETPR
jgi:hypothetical protein